MLGAFEVKAVWIIETILMPGGLQSRWSSITVSASAAILISVPVSEHWLERAPCDWMWQPSMLHNLVRVACLFVDVQHPWVTSFKDLRTMPRSSEVTSLWPVSRRQPDWKRSSSASTRPTRTVPSSAVAWHCCRDIPTISDTSWTQMSTAARILWQ